MPLYVASFFSGLIFWYAVEKVFMTQIGFSNSGIILAMMIMTVGTLIFEMPSGVLADRWSRKGVLMLAQISLMMSSLIGFLSENPAIYLVSAILWGVYSAMNSGVAESVIYDTLLEEQGSRKGFERQLGMHKIAISASLITGALVAGVAASVVDERFTFLMSVPSAFFGVIALLAFKEPTLHKAEAVASIKGHIIDSLHLIGKNQVIMLLAISTVLFNTVWRFLIEFYQIWLVDLNLHIIYFGVVLALVNSSFGVAGVIAHRVHARNVTVVAIGSATMFAVSALAVPSLYFVIPSIFISVMLLAIVTIIITGKIHDNISSNQRSSISSAISTLGTVVFIISAALASVIAKISIYLTVPILIVMLLMAVFYSRKIEKLSY